MRAVLFDFYDTLAWLEPAAIEASRQAIARRVGLSVEQLAPHWRATSRARMLGTAGDMAAQLRAIVGAAGLEPPPELIAALAEQEYHAWEQAVQLYPDTRPALAELRRRGFKLGILSNCSCQAGAVIRTLGLDALVDRLVLSYEVGLAKPDPAIYRHACAALGAAPAETAFVADGAGGELEAASALGLPTFKIRRSNARHADDPAVRADHQLASLADLLARLPSTSKP